MFTENKTDKDWVNLSIDAATEVFGEIPALDKNWKSKYVDLYKIMAVAVKHAMRPAILEFRKRMQYVNGTRIPYYEVNIILAL